MQDSVVVAFLLATLYNHPMDNPTPLYTYKNTSKQKVMLRGHGWVEPGKEATTKEVVENANFELVKESNKVIKN